jgi:hypothetical protein
MNDISNPVTASFDANNDWLIGRILTIWKIGPDRLYQLIDEYLN